MELHDNDVLDLESSPRLGAHVTCKISELLASLRFRFISNGNETADFRFFKDDGVECKLLSSKGGGWQKGKLKFQLVFIPDEPISKPTDAVISQINKCNDCDGFSFNGIR